MTEKRFHPFAVLHLLRKTILVYLLPLVQVPVSYTHLTLPTTPYV